MDIGLTKQRYQEVESLGQQQLRELILPLQMLRTYLNWSKAVVGGSCIYLINCYI